MKTYRISNMYFLLFSSGGRDGLPGYQGDVDMTCSDTEREEHHESSGVVTNEESSTTTEHRVAQVENKRKEMVHDLLDSATKAFRFMTNEEENPNSPRSPMENEESDKMKQLNRFQCFVDYCLVHTKHKKEWKLRRTVDTVSDVFTCADEALAFFTLENSCNDWKMIIDGTVPGAEQRATKVERKYSKSVYTTWGGTKKDGKKSNLQWTMKGIQRYNELHAHIKMERELTEVKELEEMLRKTYETQQGSNIKAGEDEIDFEQILNEYQQPVNEF